MMPWVGSEQTHSPLTVDPGSTKIIRQMTPVEFQTNVGTYSLTNRRFGDSPSHSPLVILFAFPPRGVGGALSLATLQLLPVIPPRSME